MPRRRGLAAVAAAALLAGVTGCQLKDSGDNLVAGKQAFVAKCGSCHVLKRAGTTGVTGPNLDEAFQQARGTGFGQTTFKGIVYRQILQPNRSPQVDPKTGKTLPEMPAKLYTGEDARNVAAYVASAVSKPGEDKGQLAAVGVKRSNKVAKESGGKLSIPADPSGGLAYQFGAAEAKPGQIEIDSQNKSSVDHDISIEGPGPPPGRHGGQAHRQVTAARRSAARCSSMSYCWPARAKKNASAKTMRMMSSTTIIPPASCWSLIALRPNSRSPRP
jgi:mono/diheme cytochrome c family protein